MNKYRRPSKFYPSIANLESSHEDVRNNELMHATESLKYLADQDKERNNPSFMTGFTDGFTSVFKEIYNGGEKVAVMIDDSLSAGGNIVHSVNWIADHPYISLSSLVLLYILIKKI
jgi:hypothetical protein